MIFSVAADVTKLCTAFMPILTIAGYVIFAIKIGVPVILIIVGMADLAKAITSKKDDEIKSAQMSLLKKAVAAVMVFLVITIVGMLMNLIGAKGEWKSCQKCLFDPFQSDCKIIVDDGTNN
ncbi:MAG: hypothetical protein RSB41_01430 [Bacilli bacterium]